MIGIKILLLVLLSSFFLSLKDRKFLLISFISSISLFILSYTFIDNSFADDRAQYYFLFKNYYEIFLYHQDVSLGYLFAFLSLFIESELAFYFTLSLIIILLHYLFIKKHLTFWQIIIYTILLAINRLYLDFEMNAIRSTLASLLLLVLYSRIIMLKNYYYLALLSIVFYMHNGLFILVIGLFISSRFINQRLSYFIFIGGSLLFLFDFNLSSILLYNTIALNFLHQFSSNIYSFINSDFVNTSWQLKIQFYIYIILPIILLYKYKIDNVCQKQFKFILFSVGFILMFYNSFPLLIRAFAFIVPLIYFEFVKNFTFKSKVSAYYICLIIFINSIVYYKNIEYING